MQAISDLSPSPPAAVWRAQEDDYQISKIGYQNSDHRTTASDWKIKRSKGADNPLAAGVGGDVSTTLGRLELCHLLPFFLASNHISSSYHVYAHTPTHAPVSQPLSLSAPSG